MLSFSGGVITYCPKPVKYLVNYLVRKSRKTWAVDMEFM